MPFSDELDVWVRSSQSGSPSSEEGMGALRAYIADSKRRDHRPAGRAVRIVEGWLGSEQDRMGGEDVLAVKDGEGFMIRLGVDAENLWVEGRSVVCFCCERAGGS